MAGSSRLLAAALALWAIAPVLRGQAMPRTVHEVERLADRRTLVTDGGALGGPPGIVFLVERDGTLAHSWQAVTEWTHSAEPTGGGSVLVTDTDGDRVVEIANDGRILWDSDDVSPFSDGSRLNYPNDAEPLAGGNVLICDRENHRVLELDRGGRVVWQFGVTGVPGSDLAHLRGPHNPERLASGNTLIADSGNNRILEVTPAGAVAWQYRPSGAAALDWPRDADETASGDVLITDSRNDRLLLVNRAGTVLRAIPTRSMPYEADELAGGAYLVGGGAAYEVDAAGTELWSYPPPRTTRIEHPAVFNASSGVDLYVTVHVPSDAGPANRRPAIVMVPGGSGDGSGFYLESEDWARLGFVAVHFDPDGRGQSTNGGTYTVEDYCGFIQQDGLNQVLRHVAGRSDVDPDRIAIYSRSYGVTMASGALARYPDDPPVAVFMDWEGPASRSETSRDCGSGHVPEPCSNNSFWAEREAVTFMPAVRALYHRIQTEVDHHPPHPGNFHAIDLANAALGTAFGGSGVAPLSQVNGELENPANRLWSLADPPAWIAEELEPDPYMGHRAQLALQRAFAMPVLSVGGSLVPGGTALVEIDAGAGRAGRSWQLAASASPGPTAIAGGGWVNLTVDAVFAATLRGGTLDAAGRAAEPLAIPNRPALSGRTFFAQAVVVLPGDPRPTAPTLCLPVTLL